MQTYEDCINSAYLDWSAWGIAIVGWIIAYLFYRFGRYPAAVSFATAGIFCGALWAYAYYESNCVELMYL